MQRIAAASSIIRDLIGPFCSTLAIALLEIGFDLGRDVLPAIMHALMTGPVSATPSQSMWISCTALTGISKDGICVLRLSAAPRMFRYWLRETLMLGLDCLQRASCRLGAMLCDTPTLASAHGAQAEGRQQQRLRMRAAAGGGSAPGWRWMSELCWSLCSPSMRWLH